MNLKRYIYDYPYPEREQLQQLRRKFKRNQKAIEEYRLKKDGEELWPGYTVGDALRVAIREMNAANEKFNEIEAKILKEKRMLRV